MTKANGDHDLSTCYGCVAEIAEMGALLRLLRLLRRDERDLVTSSRHRRATRLPRDGPRAVADRIADGRYTFDGSTHQLPVKEVDRMNALHGLVSWRAGSRSSTSTSRRLAHRLDPATVPVPARPPAVVPLGPDGLTG